MNVVGAKWVNLDSKLETQQVSNRIITKLQTQKNYKSPENCNVRRVFKISKPGKKTYHIAGKFDREKVW